MTDTETATVADVEM